MKQMKIALVGVFSLLMGITFTSCLDSDSSSSYDGLTVVTVKQDYMGSRFLLTDDGYTLVPSNIDRLKDTSGEYVKRCGISYKWNEGVVFENGNKGKSYGITIVDAYNTYAIQNFCNRSDTIKYDYPIYDVIDFNGANGEYMIVVWQFYYANNEVVAFELYPEEIDDDDVLIMRLRQSLGASGTNVSQYAGLSFTMPTLTDINNELNSSLTALNDSIKIKIGYKKSASSEELTKTKAIKVKIFD